MQIGAKLRELRLAKNLSQGDIQKRTGLFGCYTSRVEHGHTVPSVETLEKYAHALEVPLYRLFTDEDSIKAQTLRQPKDNNSSWGTRGKERDEFQTLAKAFSRMDEQDRSCWLAWQRVWRGAEKSVGSFLNSRWCSTGCFDIYTRTVLFICHPRYAF